MRPFISICIPAYKRVEFLKRLLDSIVIQRYTDFEVIITDDSPSEDVVTLCGLYREKFVLHYFKNPTALGTPENWNESIRHAKGEWIKLMHDDDWFSHPDSLRLFAEAARQHPGNFIFSSYTNVYFPEGKEEQVRPSSFRIRQLRRDPFTLLSKNCIGPPSVTLHRNKKEIGYDRNIKWLVDIDFYTHILSSESFFHINSCLIHVGLSQEQVTLQCHANPVIEIPENYYFLQKTGTAHLKNIIIYDAWWRLLRNLDIKEEKQLQQYVTGTWPGIILRMLKDLGKLPTRVVKTGILSKLFMTFSYIKNVSKAT